MNPDGSGQRRLSNDGVPGCAQEHGGAWSPDGRQIAIVANAVRNRGIVIFNADGSGERWLGRGSVPSWSPDGRRIAFRADGGIYVMNADGTGERRRITRRGAFPVWSPDGRKIAFAASGSGWHTLEIYVVNADGSGQRRLTRNTWADTDPVWSPDGRKIVFEHNWQLWIMNADGSGQRRLTLTGAHNRNPVWSPDGTKIAFERGRRKRTSYYPGSNRHEVYVMNADGSGRQRLARGAAQPTWSPDGRRIAFGSRRDGTSDIQIGIGNRKPADIWVMKADGSGPRNLTRAAGNGESSPVWSPAQK